MIEINLLPNVKRELLKTRAMRNRVISISFLVGGASIAAVVVLALFLVAKLQPRRFRTELLKIETIN